MITFLSFGEAHVAIIIIVIIIVAIIIVLMFIFAINADGVG
jgi:hypothetical protein